MGRVIPDRQTQGETETRGFDHRFRYDDGLRLDAGASVVPFGRSYLALNQPQNRAAGLHGAERIGICRQEFRIGRLVTATISIHSAWRTDPAMPVFSGYSGPGRAACQITPSASGPELTSTAIDEPSAATPRRSGKLGRPMISWKLMVGWPVATFQN